MMPVRSLRLSLAFALIWLTSQSMLAWHAPSHIDTAHQGTTALTADGHCAFGVNGHGAATIQSAELPSVPAARVIGSCTYTATHVFTPDFSASARGPPLQS